MGSEASENPGAAARSLREMWEHKTGERLGSAWDAALVDWIEKFGRGIVVDVLQRVAGDRNRALNSGAQRVVSIRDVPKFAAVEYEEEREPGMKACYLIRGLMRDKHFGDDAEMLDVLVAAMRRGMSESTMRAAVDDNETLEGCYADLGAKVSPLAALSAAMRSQRQKVFIRDTDPEWLLWQAYLRKTFGIGSPTNRNFGWFFPTRLPPDDLPSKRRRRAA